MNNTNAYLSGIIYSYQKLERPRETDRPNEISFIIYGGNLIIL